MRTWAIAVAAAILISCGGGGSSRGKGKQSPPPWWWDAGSATVTLGTTTIVFDRVIDGGKEIAGCAQSISVLTLDNAHPVISDWSFSMTFSCGDCDATWPACAPGTWGPGGSHRPFVILNYLGTPGDAWTANLDVVLDADRVARRAVEGDWTSGTFSGTAYSASLPTTMLPISGTFEAVRVPPP